MKHWLNPVHNVVRWLAWALIGLFIALGLALVPAAPGPSTQSPTAETSLALVNLSAIAEGQNFYQAGQYHQAVESWRRAISSLSGRSNLHHQALVLSYLALAYHQLGQTETAARTIAESLQLLQTHPPETSPQWQILGQVLNTQGNVQFATGQIETAAETWQRAADAFTEAGDDSRRVGSLINRAQAEQALGLFIQARRTLETVGQSLEQRPASVTKVLGLQSLGNVWRGIGELDKSRQLLEEALRLAGQMTSAKAGSDEVTSLETSTILLNLGNTAQTQQDTETALAFYERAASVADQPLLRVQALLNQLRLQQATSGNLDGALLAEIEAALPELTAGQAAIYARINYADLLGADAAYDAIAAQVFADAIRQAQRIQDPRAEAYALGYLAHLYENRERWSEAQSLTEQGLQLAQSLPAVDITYRWQWQLGRILKAQHQREQAVQAYRAAYATLQSLRSDLVATTPDLQFSFREGVEPLYREFLDLLLAPSQDFGEQRLQLARQVIESLRLAELDNFFRTACLEGQSVAIDALDQQAAAVIHPILLEDRLELILSLPGEPLQQYTVPVSRSQLEAQTIRWLRELGKPLTSPQGRQLGEELYGLLIAPLAGALSQQEVTTLVFVLDGVLRNAPIAALFDGEQYMVEKFQVALAPGLQLLDPQPLQRGELQVLAAGLTESRHGFSALTNVKAEIETIQIKASGQILLDQSFTTQTLQQEVSQTAFPVVHLATHGQFSSNLQETFVLAWDRPILINELRELLRSRDDLTTGAIELLVLSACETAAGDDRATLGLAGMAVQAGARSTLASLWSLDDQSGAEFMGEFYQALLQPGVSKAAALQQAQLALLQDPNYRHPRYWAPYVLLGNWL